MSGIPQSTPSPAQREAHVRPIQPVTPIMRPTTAGDRINQVGNSARTQVRQVEGAYLRYAVVQHGVAAYRRLTPTGSTSAASPTDRRRASTVLRNNIIAVMEWELRQPGNGLRSGDVSALLADVRRGLKAAATELLHEYAPAPAPPADEQAQQISQRLSKQMEDIISIWRTSRFPRPEAGNIARRSGLHAAKAAIEEAKACRSDHSAAVLTATVDSATEQLLELREMVRSEPYTDTQRDDMRMQLRAGLISVTQSPPRR